MRKSLLISAASLAIITVQPADAAPLQYTLSGYDFDGTREFASFIIDSNPVLLPNNIGLGAGFRVKFITGTFAYGDSFQSSYQDVSFRALDPTSDEIIGGLFTLFPTDKTGEMGTIINVFGPQLYSGSEVAPTLLTGKFTVFDTFSGAPLSLSVVSAPEPSTWAMMIGGFAAIGYAMRRRRCRISFT